MNLLRLRLGMIGTMAIMIAVSTLFFSIVLSLMGGLSLLSLALFVIPSNLMQWLFAPYLIDALYGTRSITSAEHPRLVSAVERLSQKMGLKTPRLMLATMPIPNAFAYGSPLTGSRVAVTTGLLQGLEEDEVEAVVGHELGHLKHRDVQIMMAVSVLPAIFYYLGYSMLLSSRYGRGERNQSSGGVALIGVGSMVLYWILSLLVLGLSRAREYYADRNSAMYVEDGATKLSEALAKIVSSTNRAQRYLAGNTGPTGFKALLISDPDTARRDQAVIAGSGMLRSDQQMLREIMSQEVSAFDRILEVFSTHPNIVKRLQALQKLA